MTGFPSTLLRFSLVKHHVIKYLLLVLKCLDLHNLNTHTHPGAESGGVERGHLPPLTCPIFYYYYYYIYIYIYIFFFMCVVVKGGDLIEIVINSA